MALISVTAFMAEGYEVIGMDNLLTGNIRNIEHLFPLERIFILPS